MKNLFKLTLMSFFAVSVIFAANDPALEKRQAAKAEREAANQNMVSSPAAPSSPWTQLNLGGLPYTVKHIEYRPNGIVWLEAFSGANDYSFYSKDNGKSWSRTLLPATTNAGYTNISAVNDSTAVIGDYDGNILRTVNRGGTWTKVHTYSTPDSAFFDGVKMLDANVGLAVGDADWYGLYVAKTTNGGATWTRLTNLPDSAKRVGAAAYFAVATLGGCIESFGNTAWIAYYSSSSPRKLAPVIKTTDAGATWTYSSANLNGGVNNYYFRTLHFADANNGWGVGRQSSTNASSTYPLHKTTNGGATWSDTIMVEAGVGPITNKIYHAFPVRGTSKVFGVGLAGTSSGSWVSNDNGTTWTKLVTPFTSAMRSIGAKNGDTLMIGNSNGLFAYYPSVEVTINVNTSTVPDTLKPGASVQMRGDPGPTGGLLDWSAATGVKFTNIGGDYWQAKARFAPGANFPYKIFTNVTPNVTPGHPQEHNGWEQDINNGNRAMIVGNNDTTVALQFVNATTNKATPQFWRPYVETDSLEITFRVNMANQEDLNPANTQVGVNGSFNGWGASTLILKQEANDGNNPTRYNGTKFFSGTLKLPFRKANTDTINVPIVYEYKFVQKTGADTKWENVSNRTFSVKRGSADTTLYWKWWDDVASKPPAGSDTAIVNFRVDMTRAIQTNGYVVGDTIQVRYGFANSAKVVGVKNMVKQGLTFAYTAVDSLVTGLNLKADGTGKPLVYQYYLVKNGQDFREVYYNFGYTGSDVTLAERRLLPITAKTVTALDTTKDMTKQNRWPFWRNTRKLTQNVDVLFEVNLAPAFYQVLQGAPGKDTLYDIQGPWTVTKAVKDSIYRGWGVSINGPATGGWAAWGTALYADASRKMYDNGTNGDKVAGDRIYSRIIKFYKDSLNNTVGQEFKFGIRGGDNEGGKGGFGNNHIDNINDAAATATIHHQFGQINPLYYDRWDFAAEKPLTPVSVSATDASVPTVYALEQNFPNPFNPTTSINYALPVSGFVTLKIFNVLGQEVQTLVNAEQAAGNYTASFNASALSSGVYFYKIDAGSFSSVKKMMLLK